MATALDRDIRRLLDKAVRKARIVAEDGARKALTELGVEDAKRPAGLSPEQAELRNRLRAHARSLGDVKAADDTIKANRLVREIAYEHWHRALFARFLAENSLLIDPEHKVAVSLSDLEEIAKEEGRDPVELAADWAEPMLPQIFRKDDPVLALSLPPETRAGITEMVKSLPSAVFKADDSLGWVYQFWQTDQKERVNKSEVKIGADELPAVTQLFTEDYMVLFLLENTLGAWWAGKVLAADPALAAGAASEEELREKTSPPGYRWAYLRFVREPREGETHETATGLWRPAAGAFEGWPKTAKEITVLDPCMGSGHFLVFSLPILVAFRRAEEGLDDRAAVKAVLADNLFGLEIDPRCTQIAAFALALASWKRLGGPEPLPRLNLACSGLAIGLGKAEFLKLAERISEAEGFAGGRRDMLGRERNPMEEAALSRRRGGLDRLYHLFAQAPLLGSLIDPRRHLGEYGNLFAQGFDDLSEILGKILDSGGDNHELREAAVVAQGLAKAAELLGRQFTLVATNVPYLTIRDQASDLRKYIETILPEGKADLATAMMARWLGSSRHSAFVTIHQFMFQVKHEQFREFLLSTFDLKLLCDLGEKGFQNSQAAGAFVALTLVATRLGQNRDDTLLAIDAKDSRSVEEKASATSARPFQAVSLARCFASSGRIISTRERAGHAVLGQFAACLQGTSTGDNDGYLFKHWELPRIEQELVPFEMAPDSDDNRIEGKHTICAWGRLMATGQPAVRGERAWSRPGIIFGKMRTLPFSQYLGQKFSNSSPVVIPLSAENTPAIMCFVESGEFESELRRLNPAVAVENGYLSKIPFNLAHWRRVATEKYPNGLPKPYSNDPTQWLFDGHPRGSADPNVTAKDSTNPRLVTPHGVRPGMAEHPLQVAVARLLGYRWPRQTGSSFMDCPAVTEPDGVDRSGLVDTDGIVPLPALAGEADAATRLRELIRAVWGPDYNENTVRDLLVAEEAKATDLGTWLADEFFDGHCKLFHQTPFIWHIWDGVRGGFSALVNYHRLCEPEGAGRRLLEKLRDSYLGNEWIPAQRRALAAGEPGAEDRLIAAEHLRGELTKIIEGEPPYDIFVRWKPLHRQPIGWEPDIDDGVRLNIRPFLTAKPKNPSRKDSCILRVTPRVKKHAGADRGAEPHREKGDFPWFWADDDDVATVDFAGGPTFKGRRYNDFHYTRAFKQRARDAKAAAASGAGARTPPPPRAYALGTSPAEAGEDRSSE